MKKQAALSAALLVPLAAIAAADIEAGKAKVATVCAACHGANGVSVSDTIPNLAAQRAGYIENQLRAFKDGSRKVINICARGAPRSQTRDNVLGIGHAVPSGSPSP